MTIETSRNGRGLSMVEIIIGLVILAFILIGTFTMFSGELSTIGRTRDFSAAVLIAQETIETIRNYNFEKLAEEEAGPESLEACLNGTTVSAEFPHTIKIGKITFERTVSIKNAGGGGGALPLALKTVELEIKWKDEQGRSFTPYRLATCVTKVQ